MSVKVKCGFISAGGALEDWLKNQEIPYNILPQEDGEPVIELTGPVRVGDLKSPPFDGELKPTGHRDWELLTLNQFGFICEAFIRGYRACNKELSY